MEKKSGGGDGENVLANLKGGGGVTSSFESVLMCGTYVLDILKGHATSLQVVTLKWEGA